LEPINNKNSNLKASEDQQTNPCLYTQIQTMTEKLKISVQIVDGRGFGTQFCLLNKCIQTIGGFDNQHSVWHNNTDNCEALKSRDFNVLRGYWKS
jgi:hypothetical protein